MPKPLLYGQKVPDVMQTVLVEQMFHFGRFSNGKLLVNELCVN